MAPYTTSLFASTCAFALMTLLHQGQGTTSMCKHVPPNSECPFVSSPPVKEFVTEDTVSNLTWSFKRGPHPVSDWEMRLVTKDFTCTLKPKHMRCFPGDITEGLEFNVIIIDDEADHVKDNVTTVSVSILFNEIVLEHVPYVFIKLFRTSCYQEEYRSINVNFSIGSPKPNTTTENAQIPTTTEIYQTLFNETEPITSDAESRPYLNLLTFLGLSIVSVAVLR